MTHAEHDKLMLSLDFVSEAGGLLISAGATICAAAAMENIVALEMALRSARSILIAAIDEFKQMPNNGGAAND